MLFCVSIQSSELVPQSSLVTHSLLSGVLKSSCGGLIEGGVQSSLSSVHVERV